jgi:uncharacterized protein YoxC
MSREIELLNKVNQLIDIVNSQSEKIRILEKDIENLSAKASGLERTNVFVYKRVTELTNAQDQRIADVESSLRDVESSLRSEIERLSREAWHWSNRCV